MLIGYDVSNHQHGLILDNLNPRPQFVIAKTSQDSAFIDPDYADFRDQARKMEIGFGGYHFADVDSQPNSEASCDFFIECLGRTQPGEVAALDLERFEYAPSIIHNDFRDVSNWVIRWGRRFNAVVGYKPKLYTGALDLSVYGLVRPEIPELFDYWFPYWSSRDTFPTAPAPFTDARLWQYDADQIDKDKWNGTLADFKATGVPMALIDNDQMRDQLYAMAGQVQDIANSIASFAPHWRTLGMPQHGQMTDQAAQAVWCAMEAYRVGLVLGKGEK